MVEVLKVNMLKCTVTQLIYCANNVSAMPNIFRVLHASNFFHELIVTERLGSEDAALRPGADPGGETGTTPPLKP